MKIKLTVEDTLISKFIRLRAVHRVGGCEYCGKAVASYKEIQCSHFKGRRRASTRFDPDNCAGLCFSCHSHLGENPDLHTEFFKKRLGSERFDQLIIRANTILKRSKQDKEQLRKDLRERIKALEEVI